jgi:hypothetical protein
MANAGDPPLRAATSGAGAAAQPHAGEAGRRINHGRLRSARPVGQTRRESVIQGSFLKETLGFF